MVGNVVRYITSQLASQLLRLFLGVVKPLVRCSSLSLVVVKKAFLSFFFPYFRFTILPPEEKVVLMFDRITKFHQEFMQKYRDEDVGNGAMVQTEIVNSFSACSIKNGGRVIKVYEQTSKS